MLKKIEWLLLSSLTSLRKSRGAHWYKRCTTRGLFPCIKGKAERHDVIPRITEFLTEWYQSLPPPEGRAWSPTVRYVGTPCSETHWGPILHCKVCRRGTRRGPKARVYLLHIRCIHSKWAFLTFHLRTKNVGKHGENSPPLKGLSFLKI